MQTRQEIRINLRKTTRETQIDDLINEYINLTLMEINDPAWATKGYNHNWSFNRRKDNFDTEEDVETYQLPRDLDKISIIRQTDSPTKIKYYPDEIFYKMIPNPTATGNPRCYRIWEEEGVATRLTTADTIDIVSSSASDGSTFKVSIVGYDVNGIKQSEELSLNGTTAVTGTLTYAANRPLRISKSAKTTGKITITEHSGGTTLVILGKEERSPRFKVIGLYPIPDDAITIYLEYFTRIRRLINDTDVPDIDNKWIWVVREGTLAKIYQYMQKTDWLQAQALYAAGVRSMVKADLMLSDYIPTLKGKGRQHIGIVELADEEYSVNI